MPMALPGCGYLVARDGVPARTAHDHDYILHGGGVAIAAYDPYLVGRAPVVEHRFPGLTTLEPFLALPRGRMPADVWRTAVEIAHEALPREVYVAVVYDEGGPDEEPGYRVVRPDQRTSRAHVRYEPVPGAVLELHSHNSMPAWPSETDRRDEKGFRIYGVLGRLDGSQPEVSLWLGIYGKARIPLAWAQVFEGGPGPFHVLAGSRAPEPERDLPEPSCSPPPRCDGEDADAEALLGALETLGAFARRARLGRGRPWPRPRTVGLRRPFDPEDRLG
jgi:PRTRC genetic system protein A